MDLRRRSIILLATALTLPLSAAEQKKASRQAWTSTLQCLAPLAREARSGNSPLSLNQIYFDGPFARPAFPTKPDHFPASWKSDSVTAEAAAHLGAGFSYLMAFDDARAESHFREVTLGESGITAAYIGLTLANIDDSRRAVCFFEAAVSKRDLASPLEVKWLDLLQSHLEKGKIEREVILINEWQELAEKSKNPSISAALIRQVTLFESRSPDTFDSSAVYAKLSNQFPEWLSLIWGDSTTSSLDGLPPFIKTQPQLLRLAAGNLSGLEESNTTGTLDLILNAEFERLREINDVMPEASLNLGQTGEEMIRRLKASGRHSDAMDTARQMQRLPRDAFSPGTRFRRLTRENTPWVIGRSEQASILFAERNWESLLTLPRGFQARDSAEWFSWQVIATRENDGDFNPWLAGLRQETGSDDLVDQIETYLHAKDDEIDIATIGIRGVPDSLLNSGRSTNPIENHEAKDRSHALSALKPSISRPAKNFTLPDWQNNNLSLSSWQGRPLVVIFFLGGGCLHCVEQLTAFSPWNERFEDAGIDILAVSTDPVEILSHTLSFEENPDESFPIPVVSDDSQKVFREWKVIDEFDQRAIHGTFLINPKGNIIWEEKGNTPYMHPDYLLYEAKRLLELEK
tara:strand:- start:5008 stop:6900 length:1893 start_codon:yes stop_codon:yes gene_type:complete